MNVLLAIFVSMVIYGLYKGVLGAALISAIAAGCLYMSNKRLDRLEDELYRDPRAARSILSSADRLVHDECECECMCYGSNFNLEPQNSKSELKF